MGSGAFLNLGARLLLFSIGPLAWAQSTQPVALVVTAHNAQGLPVVGASVAVRNQKTPFTAQTNDTGSVRIDDLEPGHYRLSVSARGFDNLSTDVTIGPSGDTAIDAVLNMIHTESITVQGSIETPVEEANTPSVLERQQIKNLPDRPRTVIDALPLAPGILSLPNGQLRLSGSGEHRSALLVNSATVTDPATGQFGAGVPIDSVNTISVLASPFLAEYGGFTADVVSVETRKGGDKWNFELNDPLPEFRWRSWHMVGLRSSTPRFNFGGPLIKNRLYFLESAQYEMRESPMITLSFPGNETRREAVNSLTAFDYIINGSNVLTSTFHHARQHTRFANLDYFDPREVTPNTADSTYAGDITEHATIRGTLLDSALSFNAFRAGVWPQSDLEMTLAPQRNFGNYFTTQSRTSSRGEWRETWSFSHGGWGTHNYKLGAVYRKSYEHAQVTQRPVNIVDTAGALLKRIDFTSGRPIERTDNESAFFAQDQWVVSPRFSLNYGARAGQQEVTGVFQIGPRAGLVWTPTRSGHTVVRSGVGVFYDRVPLNVYGFAFYPDQIITTYNPDGSILTGPDRYFNLTETVAPHRSPLLYRQRNDPGNFAPLSVNWSVQLEQIVSRRLRFRANYLQSHSSGLIVLEPQPDAQTRAFLLKGDGSARLRQFELTAAASAGRENVLNVSYVRSQSLGNLNEFSNYLSNFPPAVILPDARTNLPGDAPNRLLAWGVMAFPRKFRLMPKVEYRSGLPYSTYDVLQNYAGVPNRDRFPSFFSVDARATKDFKVNDKYSVRFGVSGSNLTNHFNPISIHNNVADPAHGIFFGEYRRRYTADFDVIF